MKSRSCEHKTFETHDGVELHYRAWSAQTQKAAGAIVILHRGHEHSGRNAHLVHELNLPGFAFFAWDARGHGQSPGERGFSPSVGASVRDVEIFIRHICTTYGFAEENILVIGQSVGAVLAAGWAHDYAPRIRGLVLAAPAFKIKLYVPFALPALRLAHSVKGNFFVNSYVKPQMLTHDRERAASYKKDPLIARAISVNMLLGLHDLAERIIADAQAITTPTQLLISGSDWVVHQGPQHEFFDRLGAEVKEKHVLKGFFHDTFGEKDRATAIKKVRRFIMDRFQAPLQVPCLATADTQGFTHEEAKRLAAPLPAFSPRGLYWRGVRLGLKAGGALSRGIKLGHETGFDSGSMLDYIYRNEPQGLTPLGRMMDANYLNSVGWKGIRQRKINLEELLGSAISRVSESNLPVRIMDIAAGHGRYVLDALEKTKDRPSAILLRDYDLKNVTAGRALIAQRGLSDIAQFIQGDAFDASRIAETAPHPTIGIVSGFYELFSDNAAVQASLDGLGQAIPEGGYLLYTCQPYHPQIELIARTLTSHRNGVPWVMRRRTQAEMDQLVAAAGFEKIEQRIDEWGIFTVSLARKVAA